MQTSLRHIISIAILSLFLTQIQAQYKFGLHAGVGSSNYTGKDFSSDNTPKTGITAGMYFEKEINLTIAVGTELNFEQKGTYYNFYPKIATDVSSDTYLEYLTVPILLKAYIGYNAYYYFYIGASASYLTKSSNTVKATEYGYAIASEPFFPYEFKKLDAAVLIGFGINFREIILDMRYQHGIVDIYKGENPPSIKNQFISVTLGFSIYKKKVQYCFDPRRRVK
jgi:hypothetical protein